MKGLWKEFKAFALKGNMIDLAVAVVIGTAFGAVIGSLVKSIIMPVLGYIIPTRGGYAGWHIGDVRFGEFLGELLNFAVIALAIFLLVVKPLGALMKRLASPPPPATRECPECCSAIPMKAKRCAHCGSEVPSAEPATTAP